MPLGLAFRLGAVATIAFAGMLSGAISIFAPASLAAPLEHILTVVAAAIAALKVGAAAFGLIVYRAERLPPPAGGA